MESTAVDLEVTVGDVSDAGSKAVAPVSVLLVDGHDKHDRFLALLLGEVFLDDFDLAVVVVADGEALNGEHGGCDPEHAEFLSPTVVFSHAIDLDADSVALDVAHGSREGVSVVFAMRGGDHSHLRALGEGLVELDVHFLAPLLCGADFHAAALHVGVVVGTHSEVVQLCVLAPATFFVAADVGGELFGVRFDDSCGIAVW
eukprot:CAMPEP_0116898784 /NCGR_PEP_ID=MMETSP0467-20121206/7457_1 /TAXON_ID=283647 /ORGANISM="Mesodinium pulex, Strain SPMC105" /LENGTH=200 /DNA_ID=CAMNT_0004571159 /DNA_START=190 /DNA_END=789 /DNA_ORIENTATION=+